MPRNLTDLRVLLTAEDVIACLREDPLDRVLHHANDLGPDDWDGAMATRTDDGILVIRSLRAVGADSVDDLVQVERSEGFPAGPHPGEIAVVGLETERDRFGRAVPADIAQLLHDAEEKASGRLLSWAGYEGLCVLADHPAAESGIGLQEMNR